MSFITHAWKDWTPRERRICVGICAFSLLVVAFLLRDPAVQSAGGAAKALGVVSFLVGSALSPSFFLSKFSELREPPPPMRTGLMALVALFAIGAGIDLLRSLLGST